MRTAPASQGSRLLIKAQLLAAIGIDETLWGGDGRRPQAECFEMLSRRRLSLALAIIGAFGFWLVPDAASAQGKLESLTIETAKGPQQFSVEVMRTDEERARGLMNRPYLPADRGMLFDFKQPQIASMWMKNTLIPLDMLFIRKDGTISNIAENTEPHSLRSISSTEPVTGVLELNGGTASRLGIAPGDKVRHPMFGR